MPSRERQIELFWERYSKAMMLPEVMTEMREAAEAIGIGPVRFSKERRLFVVGAVDERAFEGLVGRPPVDDELERLNCPHAGELDHQLCGWCDEHETPAWECGCQVKAVP
jgi:hypothetical protein